MIRTALAYAARHPVRAIRAVVSDPFDAIANVIEAMVKTREVRSKPPAYRPDSDWERRMHNVLGISWPCPEIVEFNRVYQQVNDRLHGAGIKIGPESVGIWNDGDAALVRAAW